MAQQTSAYNMLNKLELTITSLAGASKPVELLNQLALANETGTLAEKAMVCPCLCLLLMSDLVFSFSYPGDRKSVV